MDISLKTPYLLVEEAENVGVKLQMIPLARKINDMMINRTIRLVREALKSCEKTIRRAKISVFGVSYRPNVKNASGSLIKELVKKLSKKGASVNVYDPLFSNKELVDLGYTAKRTLINTVEGADCLLIAVGHNRFKRLNLKRIKFLVKRPAAIVDMGHVIDPYKAVREGFIYRGVGKTTG